MNSFPQLFTEHILCTWCSQHWSYSSEPVNSLSPDYLYPSGEKITRCKEQTIVIDMADQRNEKMKGKSGATFHGVNTLRLLVLSKCVPE